MSAATLIAMRGSQWRRLLLRKLLLLLPPPPPPPPPLLLLLLLLLLHGCHLPLHSKLSEAYRMLPRTAAAGILGRTSCSGHWRTPLCSPVVLAIVASPSHSEPQRGMCRWNETTRLSTSLETSAPTQRSLPGLRVKVRMVATRRAVGLGRYSSVTEPLQ